MTAISVIMCGGIIYLTSDKISDSNPISVQPIEGIQILNKTASEDGSSITVDYSLDPMDPGNVKFNTFVIWNEHYEESFESEDWYQEKDPNDYITFSLDESQHKIQFNCLQPFGTQIIFRMNCIENTKIEASLKIDYTRKKQSEASINDINLLFTDQKAIQFKKNLPQYTVGTIGEKPKDTFVLSTKFTGTKNFIDLVGEVNQTGIYSHNWKYNGESFTDPELVRSKITNKAQAYLIQHITLDENPKPFSLSEFKDIFYYQYAAYSIGGNIQYSGTNELANLFLKNFDSAVQKKSFGIEVTITYDEVEIHKANIGFQIDVKDIDKITISEDNIVF